MTSDKPPEKQPRGWFIGRWLKRYRDYCKLVQTPGYIPKTVAPVQIIFRWIFRLFTFLQIGRVKVIGAENLNAPGRLIFCPNHSSLYDGFILFPLMKRSTRYMGAHDVMGGLQGVIAGALGGFAVDRSRGSTIIEPAIKVFLSGADLAMFPEGKISPDGEYLPFKTGAARIALAAWDRLGKKERIGLVPIHICYHKRHSPSGNTTLRHMGFKWRGGATVTVGKPIYLDELASLDADDITACLRAAVVFVPCATAGGAKQKP